MKKSKRKARMPLLVRQAEKAMKIAVAKVIEDHHRRGEPIVIWKNGKVTKVRV